MALPRVVFPQPLSPARPKTSPLKISKSTPSTAKTCPTTRLNTPACTGKCTFTPRNLRISFFIYISQKIVRTCDILLGEFHLFE